MRHPVIPPGIPNRYVASVVEKPAGGVMVVLQRLGSSAALTLPVDYSGDLASNDLAYASVLAAKINEAATYDSDLKVEFVS